MDLGWVDLEFGRWMEEDVREGGECWAAPVGGAHGGVDGMGFVGNWGDGVEGLGRKEGGGAMGRVLHRTWVMDRKEHVEID